MRRRAGIGAIQKQRLEQEKYRDKGTELQENQLEQMAKQLDVFKVNLEEFATNHKTEIRKNAAFRRQFQEMCASIGVDPLRSGKGFWSVLGIGDFYYELAVQIIEVCMASNHRTGGLISLEELRTRLVRARGGGRDQQEISCDDLLRAAKKLSIFGSGFGVVPIGKGQYMVQSVPGELNMDHTAILRLVIDEKQEFASVTVLVKKLNWGQDRAKQALNQLLDQGLVWVDLQDTYEERYYFPSLFAACINSSN